MRIEYENPKLKQNEIVDQLGCPTSILQRNRIDNKKLTPYRIQSNITSKRTKKASNTNSDNNSQNEHALKRPRLTPN